MCWPKKPRPGCMNSDHSTPVAGVESSGTRTALPNVGWGGMMDAN